MKESGKFLFLDPADGGSPSPAAVTHATEEGCPCEGCEDALSELIAIIRASGQDPVTQLSGYLITEDPIDLPEEHHARAIARRVGRDKLLETLIELYIRYCPAAGKPD